MLDSEDQYSRTLYKFIVHNTQTFKIPRDIRGSFRSDTLKFLSAVFGFRFATFRSPNQGESFTSPPPPVSSAAQDRLYLQIRQINDTHVAHKRLTHLSSPMPHAGGCGLFRRAPATPCRVLASTWPRYCNLRCCFVVSYSV